MMMVKKTIKGDILAAIERMLRSVVRFALQRAVQYPDIESALRRALVSVATEIAEKQGGEPPSISTLSVLSGLQRKQVRDSAQSTPEATEPVLTKVIGQWCAHPDYCMPNGAPKPLSVTGVASEFFELVSSVTADVSPYSVLKVLEASELVSREDDRVHLTARAHEPSSESEGLDFMALDFDDFVKAINGNLLRKQEVPNLHLTTVYDNICRDAVPELKAWILEEGGKFHERIRQKIARFDKDANPALHAAVGGARVVVCSFSLSEESIK